LLEGIEVGLEHVSTFDASKVENWSLADINPVSVLADQELIIGAADQAVHGSAEQADLHLAALA
jgi:hypothetical protein